MLTVVESTTNEMETQQQPQIQKRQPEDEVKLMFSNVEEKIKKRRSKGDKQSLERTLKIYKQLYAQKKLNLHYLSFHSKYLTKKNVPDYIIPIIQEHLQMIDVTVPTLNREEKRDSDLVKLSGCKNYSVLYQHIKHFSFVKSKNKPLLNQMPVITDLFTDDVKQEIKNLWIFDQSCKCPEDENVISTKIADIIFEKSALISSVCVYQFKNHCQVMPFVYVKKSKGNKKYFLIDDFSFDLEDIGIVFPIKETISDEENIASMSSPSSDDVSHFIQLESDQTLELFTGFNEQNEENESSDGPFTEWDDCNMFTSSI